VNGARGLVEGLPELAPVGIADQRIERLIVVGGSRRRDAGHGKSRGPGESAQETTTAEPRFSPRAVSVVGSAVM